MRNVTDAIELVPLDEDSYGQDRLGFFARLRESRPVAPVRMPGYGRAWIVTRYDDVRAVLSDPRMAKDVHRWPGGGRSRPSEATGVYAHMLHADPPEHTRLRRLVQKPFASRRAALRPRTEEIAAGLLDEMEAARSDVIDLLDAYARPLPITVICELLGVPVQDREWIRVIVYAYDERREHARVERELAAYFTELIAAKRAEPGDDLVSDLIIASDIAGAGRDASGHVAFGHGVHHCLGAPLARMEAEVALSALLARFPRISLAAAASELRWRPVSVMNGLQSLPVRRH